MATEPQRGAVGNTRSIGLSILWAILTLGIYTFIWTYKTQEEVKRYSGNGVGGVIGLVIYILISPVTFFIVSDTVLTPDSTIGASASPTCRTRSVPSSRWAPPHSSSSTTGNPT